MGLKLAIAGKGGSGKSTLSALLCRSLLAKEIKPLLAVDADPNSCLPEKLGVGADQTIGALREELRKDPNKKPEGISKNEWIELLINESVSESTGLDVVVMGRQEGRSCYCYINSLLRNCLDKLGDQYEAVVIDNEAGLEHLSRRSNGSVDVLLVACPATIIGARTAQRIVELIDSLELDIGSRYLVLNVCETEVSQDLLDEFGKTGLEILGTVPMDIQVLDFEMSGQALLELPGDSPAAAAVDELVTKLLERKSS